MSFFRTPEETASRQVSLLLHLAKTCRQLSENIPWSIIGTREKALAERAAAQLRSASDSVGHALGSGDVP